MPLYSQQLVQSIVQSAASASAVGILDCSGLDELLLEVTTDTWTGTLSFLASATNSNLTIGAANSAWTPCVAYRVGDTARAFITTTTLATALYIVPVTFRYFSLTMTTLTMAGSVTTKFFTR